MSEPGRNETGSCQDRPGTGEEWRRLKVVTGVFWLLTVNTYVKMTKH
jgi:hypothetical protein